MITAWALLLAYTLGGQLVEVRLTEGVTLAECQAMARGAEQRQRQAGDGRRLYSACLPVAGADVYRQGVGS